MVCTVYSFKCSFELKKESTMPPPVDLMSNNRREVLDPEAAQLEAVKFRNWCFIAKAIDLAVAFGISAFVIVVLTYVGHVDAKSLNKVSTDMLVDPATDADLMATFKICSALSLTFIFVDATIALFLGVYMCIVNEPKHWDNAAMTSGIATLLTSILGFVATLTISVRLSVNGVTIRYVYAACVSQCVFLALRIAVLAFFYTISSAISMRGRSYRDGTERNTSLTLPKAAV